MNQIMVLKFKIFTHTDADRKLNVISGNNLTTEKSSADCRNTHDAKKIIPVINHPVFHCTFGDKWLLPKNSVSHPTAGVLREI